MTRLTAAIRDAIIDNAVKNKDFKGREKAICKKRSEFAFRVRAKVMADLNINDALLDNMSQQVSEMNQRLTNSNGDSFARVSISLDTGWFEVNLAGQRRRMSLSGCNYSTGRNLYGDSTDETTRDIPVPLYRNHVIADPAWREELDAIDAEHEKLIDEQETLKTTMKAAIGQFTTVEKLLEAWPEVKELIPDTLPIANKPGTGIALSVADLNALCGIPTGK